MTSTATMGRLLDSIRDHLKAHHLPAEIASIAVTYYTVDDERITVHLTPALVPALAASLLDWADTVTTITVTAWRPPHGQTVHLTLSGRLPDSTPVEVYGGVDYSEALFGDLQPGGRQGVALSMLHQWAAGSSAVVA